MKTNLIVIDKIIIVSLNKNKYFSLARSRPQPGSNFRITVTIFYHIHGNPDGGKYWIRIDISFFLVFLYVLYELHGLFIDRK